MPFKYPLVLPPPPPSRLYTINWRRNNLSGIVLCNSQYCCIPSLRPACFVFLCSFKISNCTCDCVDRTIIPPPPSYPYPTSPPRTPPPPTPGLYAPPSADTPSTAGRSNAVGPLSCPRRRVLSGVAQDRRPVPQAQAQRQGSPRQSGPLRLPRELGELSQVFVVVVVVMLVMLAVL